MAKLEKRKQETEKSTEDTQQLKNFITEIFGINKTKESGINDKLLTIEQELAKLEERRAETAKQLL